MSENDKLWEIFSELYEKSEGVKPHPRDKYHKHHFELFKMGWDAHADEVANAFQRQLDDYDWKQDRP